MSQARLVLWIALVLASADALPTPRLPWPIRRQGPVGPDRADDGGILRSLRGGAPRVKAAAMVGASIGTMAHLHRFVRQWASAAGLLASLCFTYPHLPRDFSSCWYRLALGGFLVSIALVSLAVPQVVKLSGGVLPDASASHIAGILMNALPTQTLFKMVQYFTLRSTKLALDGVKWMPSKTLNTVLCYGMTASIMQCAAYNNVCWHTYHFHDRDKIIFQKHDIDGKGRHTGLVDVNELKAALSDAKVDLETVRDYHGDDIIVILKDDAGAVQLHHNTHGRIKLDEFRQLVARCAKRRAEQVTPIYKSLMTFLRTNVIPGILFSFLRECGGTGVGLVVSPQVRLIMAPVIGKWPPVFAKIVSGMIAGMFCSFCTQWLHNNALRAANIYQYSGQLPSTATVLEQTWKELGVRMFYLNADRRVLSTATATTILGLVDIFA